MKVPSLMQLLTQSQRQRPPVAVFPAQQPLLNLAVAVLAQPRRISATSLMPGPGHVLAKVPPAR